MFQKLKPHIFSVGEQTYRNVKSLIEPVNQSIVVSGESGAGKVGGPLSHPVNFGAVCYLVIPRLAQVESQCAVVGKLERKSGDRILAQAFPPALM